MAGLAATGSMRKLELSKEVRFKNRQNYLNLKPKLSGDRLDFWLHKTVKIINLSLLEVLFMITCLKREILSFTSTRPANCPHRQLAAYSRRLTSTARVAVLRCSVGYPEVTWQPRPNFFVPTPLY